MPTRSSTPPRFVWTARAAGIITGSHRYLDGTGEMDWKLAGLVTVAHAQGPDVACSAADRAGAEAIWLPTALLPRFGLRWSAESSDQVTASFRVGDTLVGSGCGWMRADCLAGLDRWGDPDSNGSFGWHRFGGELTGYHNFQGLTIPSQGRLGGSTAATAGRPASSSATSSPTWRQSPARTHCPAGDGKWPWYGGTFGPAVAMAPRPGWCQSCLWAPTSEWVSSDRAALA